MQSKSLAPEDTACRKQKSLVILVNGRETSCADFVYTQARTKMVNKHFKRIVPTLYAPRRGWPNHAPSNATLQIKKT